MWVTFLTFIKAIVCAFSIISKIGQFIVTSLSFLLTLTKSLIIKLSTLLTIMFEDFMIFLQDVIHVYARVREEIVYIFEWMIENITYCQEIIYVPKWSYKVFIASLSGILNGIKHIFIYIKHVIILFGDGIWFIIVFIPKSLLYLGSLTFSYIINSFSHLCKNMYSNVKLVYKLVSNSLYNCYYFITDVPLESAIGLIIGLCFLYIFIQFYDVIFTYLRQTLFAFLINTRLEFNRAKTAIRDVLTRCTFKQRFRQILRPKPSTSIDETKIDTLCIVCQDNTRNVVFIPCKHLCLCHDCSPRLMQGSRKCPLCRRRIHSSMKVYT